MDCTCPFCDSEATVAVEGGDYCEDCEEYATTTTGEVVCATHGLDGEVPEIDWGPILTGPPGSPNAQYGTDGEGREWTRSDRGGWTVPVPVEEDEAY